MGSKPGFFRRIFSRKYRPDGEWVENLDAMQQILPYVIRSRHAASVYFTETIDITHTLNYIRRHNAHPEIAKLSLFTVFLAALLRTGVLHPRLNHFVAGKRIYARNQLQASFVMKAEMSEKGREVVVKMTFNPEDTLADVATRVNRVINKVRTGNSPNHNTLMESVLKLPSFMLSMIFAFERILDGRGLLPKRLIDTDPLYSSIFIANLGSLALGPVLHPLYERGTVSLFAVLSEHREARYIEKDGRVGRKNVVDMTFTIDSRITGGFSIAEALQTLRALMENPELLEKQCRKEDLPGPLPARNEKVVQIPHRGKAGKLGT